MAKNKLFGKHTLIILVGLLFFVALFAYFRLLPISTQTVPYTYDQGRDFIAARDIIVNKDITLIGPTTGAEGVFHGAWWYYFLAIPFVFTSGAPIAYYYFIAISALVVGLSFYYFLHKEFSPLLGLLFFSLVATSPYFIRTSIFAISSIMTLPFILLCMFALFEFLKTKKLIYLGLFGFSIGMIFEGEVAFGVFMIPSVILAILMTRQVKTFFGSPQKIVSVIGGGTAAMILRITFELKNNFLQTKNLLGFQDTPGTNPLPLSKVIEERFDLFIGYYKDIFTKDLRILGFILLGMAIFGLWKGYKKLNDHEKVYARFLSILVLSLYAVSLVYTKNFFWHYYFEGIQYFMLGVIVVGLYPLSKIYPKYFEKFIIAVILVVALTGGYKAYSISQEPANTRIEGLRMQKTAVEYIVDNVNGEPFCLQMYTPPVATYTYDYLLDYYARTTNFTYPRTEYQNNECWYFIEADTVVERRQAWIDKNIPSEAELIEEHKVSDALIIQKYQLQSK